MILLSVMQRPPTSPVASSTTQDQPAATRWRAAEMQDAPAPTTITSTPERGVAVFCCAAPKAGAVVIAAVAARNERRVRAGMAGHCPIQSGPANDPPRQTDAGGLNGREESCMIAAAVKALVQMFSPPFRTVLLKAMGLALLLIIVAAIALHRILVWVV